MNEAKSFASLRPTLLARKGGARPAMRPSAVPITGFEANAAFQIDDLGWNDMGDDEAGDHEAQTYQGAEVLPLTPGHVSSKPLSAIKPTIRRQQEALTRKLSGSPLSRRSALTEGRRAAFTLRLDGDRHLKLRLASTIRNRSAQQIVTEALDMLLSDIPELELLADQVKRK